MLYSKNKIVLEAGCGTGVLSIYFKKNGFESYAIDNDNNQLNLVKKIAKSLNVSTPILKKINIFELSNYFSNYQIDVVYSIGVFEHFSDTEIEKLLKEQLKISNYVFVGIPTKYFNESEKLYGNERFLEIKYWRNLFSSDNYRIVEEFSCYNGNFINRLKNYKKWFKISPIHVFVIESCNK